MTPETAAPLGLYSIGVRDLDVSALLTLAAGHRVPFLHLRGGPKGYDLARCDRAKVAAWARQARDGVPVTMVTADLDLADFLQPAALEHRRACAGLERLAEAAAARSHGDQAAGPPAARGRGMGRPGPSRSACPARARYCR